MVRNQNTHWLYRAAFAEKAASDEPVAAWMVATPEKTENKTWKLCARG